MDTGSFLGLEQRLVKGLVHMFAEDGTLMATAAQSCIVRFWKE
jgi:acyl-CoA thioesterase